MNWKRVVFVGLAALSAALALYKANTSYSSLEASAQLFQSIGFGLGPWFVGLALASVSALFCRVLKKSCNFAAILLWSAGVMVALLVASSLLSAQEGYNQAIRDDALLIMGASVYVPSVSAYCNKYVEENPSLVEAAERWNTRHMKVMERVVQIVKRSGGLSAAEKDLIDRAGYALLKKEVEGASNKPGYCQELAVAIDNGTLDLARRKDTASALKRIMSAKPE